MKISNKEFATKIFTVFEDRSLQVPSTEWIESLYLQCKGFNLESGFQRVMAIPAIEWNKTYGFGGKPNLVGWIELLTGEKPLTDAEKLEANAKHDEKLRIWVGTIIVWINDQNLDTLFKSKYSNPENQHLINLIDKYAKKAKTDEEVLKLGRWLKSKYDADKIDFKAKLKGIAEHNNPMPFAIETKTQQSNIIQLPTPKRM